MNNIKRQYRPIDVKKESTVTKLKSLTTAILTLGSTVVLGFWHFLGYAVTFIVTFGLIAITIFLAFKEGGKTLGFSALAISCLLTLTWLSSYYSRRKKGEKVYLSGIRDDNDPYEPGSAAYWTYGPGSEKE